MTLYNDALKVQLEIARQVIDRDDFGEINSVCAVDVAYDDSNAYCSAVVMSRSGEPIESANTMSKIESPYVPGLLMLRESPPIIRTLEKIRNGYDLLLVDGHGLLHPRKCGIACYLGVKLDKPTIGIAKSLLCGTLRNNGSIELDGEILGHTIGEGRKMLYISVGHRISLGSAVSLALELGKGTTPEAMKQADKNSKEFKKRKRVD
ncbi:MAG TPA: endonuclease V [Nitrososphaera sp.]|jgi:deoxyribonuclease V|nr:endonuclease V [Nitrososphaera sp.]